MVSPKNSSIFLLSFTGNSSQWDKTFLDPADEFVGYEHNEVLPVIEEVSKAVEGGYYAAGFLSYEAAPAFDPSHEGKDPEDFPRIWFRTFNTMVPRGLRPTPSGDFFVSPLEPEITREEYVDKVQGIRKLISSGEVYQVNFTYRLEGKFEGSEASYFHRLCDAESSSYGAYIDCGRYVILSASPELFFHSIGRSISVKPMKGTIRRGDDEVSDRNNRVTLENSPKDRSENLMIVDLMRNDLGRISVPGSVQASSLFEVERYETLYQMVSEIRSTLREDVTIRDLMGSLFPCGSVTGAPKIRSMQIINNLEVSPRKIYSGAIGYLTPYGEAAFNVAIRTAVIDRVSKSIIYGTGGGIIHDSIPREEYIESELKSSFIRQVKPSFKLIETILYEPGEGFFLLEEHLVRIEKSASFFGFPFEKRIIVDRLKEEVEAFRDSPMRIRLLLDKGGLLEVESSKMMTPRSDDVHKVHLYEVPVDENSIFLYHKTTVRDFYDYARSRHPDADELLFVNRKGEVTEGTRTNVVIRKEGAYYTPPVESGLLPGTFREKLLERGKISERKLSISDLISAEELFLINSVRKWVKGKVMDTEAFSCPRESRPAPLP